MQFVADAFRAVFKVPGHSFVIGHGVKNFEWNRIICLDLGYLTLDGDEIAWSVFGNAVRLALWAHQLQKPAYSQNLNPPLRLHVLEEVLDHDGQVALLPAQRSPSCVP